MKKNVLNGAGIFLIAIILLLSTAAANIQIKNEETKDNLIKCYSGPDSEVKLEEKHMTSSPSPIYWVYYHTGYANYNIGVTGGGTYEAAIRLTPDELAPDYCNCKILGLKFYHNVVEGTSEIHDATAKLYGQGSPSSPGTLITSKSFDAIGTGWIDVLFLSQPVINCQQDYWVSVEITHAEDEYPIGLDAGPAIDGKGDWIGPSWKELQNIGFDRNWCLEAKVLCGGFDPLPDVNQLGIELDTTWMPNSPLGEAVIGGFDTKGDNGIKYVNMVFNEAWVIQNVPVHTQFEEQSILFNLGVEEGQDIQSAMMAYTATDEPLDYPSYDMVEIPVYSREYKIKSGEEYELLNIEAIPVAVIGGFVLSSYVIDPADVVNQPCGINECAPAAISNSLKYLNEKHGLGMSSADISISKMKDATGWHSGGAPAGSNPWWERKKQYMEDNGYPITTTIYSYPYDLNFIMNELARGQDVELRIPGHVLCIVGITKCNNGEYSIHVAHDTDQGDSGGEIIEVLQYDPSTNEFTSAGWEYGRTMGKIVVECPKNEAPYKPYTPVGPIKFKVNELKDYTTLAIDPEEDLIYFLWDWGDGTTSDWEGPYESQVTVTASHSWSDQGNYQIKVKAKDEYETESEWSDPLSISLPRNRAINNPFIGFLQQYPILYQLLQRFLQL